MDVLNFSSYAKAIELGTVNTTQLQIAEALLNFIFDRPDVLNKNKQPYILSSQVLTPWWNQSEDIPGTIKKAASTIEIAKMIDDYFLTTVYPLLSPQKEGLTYSQLISLINAQNMADTERTRLLTLYEDGENSEFLAQTYLHAIQNKNNKATRDKKRPSASVQQDLDALTQILARYPKPILLVPPEELDDIEMVYIQALLDAYADAEGIDIISREDLEKYRNYKRDFSRQRKRFYAAESIQRSLRDTILPDELDNFGSLKKETLDCIEPVLDRKYNNGFEKLDKVMEHATLIQLNKSMLAQLPGWIGANERMGLCHMLVNDNEFRWVDDYE